MRRFSIDIDKQFDQTLERLAEGGTKADVIRRAVQTYSFLKAQVSEGKQVAISNAEAEKILNIVNLP